MNLRVEIPASAWRPAEADRSRLITTLTLNGVQLHLEAIEVMTGEGRIQRASDESDQALASIHEAVGADGHWEMLEIAGRDYVVIATPFC
jgi:hypothetical protein